MYAAMRKNLVGSLAGFALAAIGGVAFTNPAEGAGASPPVFAAPSGGYRFSIREDKAPGTLVGKVRARDPDARDRLTYAIVMNEAGPNPFSIDPASGSVRVGDFAGMLPGTASLTVQATDLAGLSAEAPLAITVKPADLRLDLKVLVLAVGDASEDPGLAYIGPAMQQMGVPYEVFDASRQVLSDSDLRRARYHGRYNGIILTDSQLLISHEPKDVEDPQHDAKGAIGFGVEEWQILHGYERDFQVRESVLAGFPATVPARGIDYGMKSGDGVVVGAYDFRGIWSDPAGGKEIFEYVNTSTPLTLGGWTVAWVPERLFGDTGSGSGGEPAVSVQPLLSCDSSVPGRNGEICPPGSSLLAWLRYSDGRQVLLSTLNSAYLAMNQLPSRLLSYEFVNFATRGVFLGARKVSLGIHVDDLLFADGQWDPDHDVSLPVPKHILEPPEVANAVRLQEQFRTDHPLVGSLTLDMAINGAGADPQSLHYNEPVTQAVVTHRKNFRFLSHTYSHVNMDARRDQDGLPTGMGYDAASQEIRKNLAVWRKLKLPGAAKGTLTLISGEHSGLADYRENGGLAPLAFPEGINADFLNAALDAGVKVIAGDASRSNQDRDTVFTVADTRTQKERSLVLAPRWPTVMFYDTHTPDLVVDQYNYRYSDRVRNYEEIVQGDAAKAVLHMLSFCSWPHYFHQTNLHDYGDGKTLLFDWLGATLNQYESVMKLPVSNLPFWQNAQEAAERLSAASAGIDATWYLGTNRVVLRAQKPARLPVTGLEQGRSGKCRLGVLYGGQCQTNVQLKTKPVTLYVDRELAR